MSYQGSKAPFFSKKFECEKGIDSDDDVNNFVLCLDTEDDSLVEKRSRKDPSRFSMRLPERPKVRLLSPEKPPSPYNLFKKKKDFSNEDLSPKQFSLLAAQKNELSCTESEEENEFSRKESGIKKDLSIQNIKYFRKKFKKEKMKIEKNRKLSNDYESICLNDYFILERLNNKKYRNTSCEASPFVNSDKRLSPSILNKRKHSNILNSLEQNAKKWNLRKKTYS